MEHTNTITHCVCVDVFSGHAAPADEGGAEGHDAVDERTAALRTHEQPQLLLPDEPHAVRRSVQHRHSSGVWDGFPAQTGSTRRIHEKLIGW